MKILYIGAGYGYPSAGYPPLAHGSAGRDSGLAWGLARCGHVVDIVSATSGPTAEGPRRVAVADVHPCNFDAVVVCGALGIACVEREGWTSVLAAHPRVAVQVDAIYSATETTRLAWADVVAYSNRFALDTYRAQRLRKGQQAVLLPWGFPEPPLDLSDPWNGAKACPRVLFAGVLHQAFLRTLQEIAACAAGRWEVWIAGPGVDPQTGVVGPLVADTSGLHICTDVVAPGVCSKGTINYGSLLWSLMQHANVGVSFAPRATSAVASKLYDYLACGLPTITDSGSPNSPDVLRLNAGRIVPWGDLDAFVAALVAELATQRDRRQIAAGAQQRTWTTVAGELLRYLDAPAPGDPVGGTSCFTDPAEVLRWCEAVGGSGSGRVIAERSDKLQRTLIAWQR